MEIKYIVLAGLMTLLTLGDFTNAATRPDVQVINVSNHGSMISTNELYTTTITDYIVVDGHMILRTIVISNKGVAVAQTQVLKAGK